MSKKIEPKVMHCEKRGETAVCGGEVYRTLSMVSSLDESKVKTLRGGQLRERQAAPGM